MLTSTHCSCSAFHLPARNPYKLWAYFQLGFILNPHRSFRILSFSANCDYGFNLCTSDLGDGCGGSFAFKTSPGLCRKFVQSIKSLLRYNLTLRNTSLGVYVRVYHKAPAEECRNAAASKCLKTPSTPFVTRSQSPGPVTKQCGGPGLIHPLKK